MNEITKEIIKEYEESDCTIYDFLYSMNIKQYDELKDLDLENLFQILLEIHLSVYENVIYRDSNKTLYSLTE